MKNILWVGNPFFGAKLSQCGFKVTMHNPPLGGYLDWAALEAICGGAPDIVVVADKSLPPFVLGMEDFPCLTVFYAVDTHIHHWYPMYAQAFDLCLVSLRDHMPSFAGLRLGVEQIHWSPPYAPDLGANAPPPFTPEWDVLFVGKVDKNINPERHAFLHGLGALLPGLHITQGNFVQLYPKGRLVLNHSIAADLNFRVFEAAGCGACLLTSRVGHGLTDIFTDGYDLYLYDQDDLPGLAALALDVLQNPAVQDVIRKNALTTIDGGHRAMHRAKFLASLLTGMYESGEAVELVRRRLETGAVLHECYLRFMYLLHAESMELPNLREAYLAAAHRHV